MIRLFSHHIRPDALRQALFDLGLVLLAVGAAYLVGIDDFGMAGLGGALALLVPAIVLRRGYAAHLDRPSQRRSRILIYGSGKAAVLVAETLRAADPRALVVGFVRGPNESEALVAPALLLPHGDLRRQARALRADRIVVALNERRGGSMPLAELLECKTRGVQVCDLSTYFESMLGQIRIEHVHAGWLIFGDGFAQGTLRRVTKRGFDVAVSLLLLAIGLPLMLLAALLIVLDSRGPILYSQERVGRNGRAFRVLKFRSMRHDAEGDGRPRWASLADDRITRVGSVMRRLRIDELPQLVNVLRGDMSMVGPRPERPFFVDQLAEQIPYYALRHSVKPGLTGWAQVRYAYGATVNDALEKLQYDLYYVKNHTLFLDLCIVVETVGVVVSGRGAR